MGPFYAYLKNDNDDNHYRYLITFSSRKAADEWWRMISAPSSPYAGKIIRTAPQFYTQNDPSNNNVTGFFYKAGLPDAFRFHRRMFITVIYNSNDGNIPFVIPSATITDHISGRWYFIRSKADPWSHWYVRIKGVCLICGDANCNAVHVSSEYRTRFCIRARNAADENSQEAEDFVMIGKDEISIVAPKGYTLHIDNEEDLKVTKGYQGETDLIFDDLKNRFSTQAEKQVNGEVWEYVAAVERGAGEPWELVD